MSDADLREMLEEIRDGSREGRGWRERAEAQLVDAGKSLVMVSAQIQELERIVSIQFDNGRSRFQSLESRIAAIEKNALQGSAAVDVNISQGNQTVGAEAAPPSAPAARASKSGAAVAAGSGGVGGFLVWLVSGGGWDTLAALWKRISG